MNTDNLPSIVGLRADDASCIETEAILKRARAAVLTEPLEIAKLQAEAQGLETLAARLRDPTASGIPDLVPGRGGEVSPLPAREMPLAMRDVAEAVQSPPDVLAAEASMSRLSLAREAGVLTEAVEAAESIEAENAIEQMMVHQITAAHRVSMRLFAASDAMLRRHEQEVLLPGSKSALVEASRSALAGARLMDSASRAASALDRMRNGGRQHVTVKHLTVADGGQAVVTGSVETGTGSARSGRTRRERGSL